jgi:hypothetical protein
MKGFVMNMDLFLGAPKLGRFGNTVLACMFGLGIVMIVIGVPLGFVGMLLLIKKQDVFGYLVASQYVAALFILPFAVQFFRKAVQGKL